MSKLIPLRISKRLFFGLLALFVQLAINAQEETVIDNKGNIILVKNNTVTTALTSPVSPLENDIWFDTTANLTKIYDGTAWLPLTTATETITNLVQDTATGAITYSNETPADQTANVVANETTNDISVGANGGAFYESPVKAFGKISAGGAAIRITAGVTVARLSRGYYRITLPAGLVADANYIIQVSQLGRGGAGSDDPGISYNNQTTTFFDVIVGDNDNGGTDRARFDGEFMFTILDL